MSSDERDRQRWWATIAVPAITKRGAHGRDFLGNWGMHLCKVIEELQ